MLPKLAVSITSFLPLYFLMAIMYIYGCLNDKTMDNDTRNKVFLVIAIIFILQLIFIFLVGKYIKDLKDNTISDNEVVFSDIKEDKKAYVDYMMTYLLPLLIFDSDKINWFYIVYTNVFILIFILINAHSENFSFNIVLWARGYRIYKGINSRGEEKTLIIQKRKFSNIRDNHYRYKFIAFGGSQDIYLCKQYNR